MSPKKTRQPPTYFAPEVYDDIATSPETDRALATKYGCRPSLISKIRIRHRLTGHALPHNYTVVVPASRERAIAFEANTAKEVARKYKVTIDRVYYLRKKYHGPQTTDRIMQVPLSQVLPSSNTPVEEPIQRHQVDFGPVLDRLDKIAGSLAAIAGALNRRSFQQPAAEWQPPTPAEVAADMARSRKRIDGDGSPGLFRRMMSRLNGRADE